MLNPRALTHAQLAELVADVQAILWQESRMLPDDPRQYGNYWNPGKEDDGEGLEQIADILADADLKGVDIRHEWYNYVASHAWYDSCAPGTPNQFG